MEYFFTNGNIVCAFLHLAYLNLTVYFGGIPVMKELLLSLLMTIDSP